MDINHEPIYRWIDSHQISRHKKLINRDFSDAVPLAEILKHHFPKLVELHNYAPRNSVSMKLENWNTLQRKVLSKLNINLSKEMLEDLAKSEPGVIEKVLMQIKYKIDKQDSKRNSEVSLVEGSKHSLNCLEEQKVRRRSVPAGIVEEMLKDLEDKEREIKALRDKVRFLQDMLNEKDTAIEDMKLKVSSCSLSSKSGVFHKLINSIF